MNLTFRMFQHTSSEVTVTKTTIKFKHSLFVIFTQVEIAEE